MCIVGNAHARLKQYGTYSRLLSQFRRPRQRTSSGARRFWAAWMALNLVGKPTTPVCAVDCLARTSRMKATEFPPDFEVPEAGVAWRDLVHDADPKSGLQAFAVCPMMSLRSGKVWIDHSLSFRQRDQMLISPQEWARECDKYIALLGFRLFPTTLILYPTRLSDRRTWWS